VMLREKQVREFMAATVDGPARAMSSPG